MSLAHAFVILNTVSAFMVGALVFVPLLNLPDGVDVFKHNENVSFGEVDSSITKSPYSMRMLYVNFIIINHGSKKPANHIRVSGVVYEENTTGMTAIGEDTFLFYNETKPGRHSGALLIAIGDLNTTTSVAYLSLQIEGRFKNDKGDNYEIIYQQIVLTLEGSSPWKWVF